jgi:tetratricopeptide (TPR) repeat protein
MRYLRLLWTLVTGALGSPKSIATLRHGMATLNAIDGFMEPYRRGDYEAALQATESFRQDGDVTASYCFYRGSCLAHLGRLPEAEVWLRRNIALRKEDQKRHLAIGYTTLGHLMLQAGRYDDAVECFQTSLHHFPGRSSGYRSMAEAYLLRGDNPSEALRWTRLAIDQAKGDREISPELRKMNLGESFATLAWATAAASHTAPEVARLVAEAVAGVGAGSISSTAQVHYQSGRAYEELGDAGNSLHHYREAARLDLQGEWGRAGRAALAIGVAP